MCISFKRLCLQRRLINYQSVLNKDCTESYKDISTQLGTDVPKCSELHRLARGLQCIVNTPFV